MDVVMSKKLVIIISSTIFTCILLLIWFYRLELLQHDTSGFYTSHPEDLLINIINYLPEISIAVTIVAIFTRKSAGLILTVLANILAVAAFAGELFVKLVKLVDIVSKSEVPLPCVPWLNLPVMFICLILFILKFHIYTLPDEIKIKIK